MELKDISNKQEMFNFAVGKILKQGCKSLNKNGECSYRGDNDTKCIAGFLIADEHYVASIETHGVKGEIVCDVVSKSLPNMDLDAKNMTILRDMQNVHDRFNIEDWEKNFKSVAKMHLIDYSPMIK